jgi:hypothetical protein
VVIIRPVNLSSRAAVLGLALCLVLLPLAGTRCLAQEDAPAPESTSANPAETPPAPPDTEQAGGTGLGLGLSGKQALADAAGPGAAAVLTHEPHLPDAGASADTLRGILARPEFKDEETIASGDNPIEKFLAWLMKLFGGGNPNGGSWVTVLITVALLGLLAYLITRLIWELVQRRSRKAFSGEGQLRAEDMTAAALLKAAAEAAERREFREALRMRFLALVKQLDLAATTVQTNSQLARQVRKAQPAAAVPFAGAVACYEDAWYGGLPCGAETYAELSGFAAEVLGYFTPAEEAKT